MSDRYETPSWGDEPDDSATRSPVAGEPREPLERTGEAGEEDLDASSENVLDGWPAIDPSAESAQPLSDAAPSSDAASSIDPASPSNAAAPVDAAPAAAATEVAAPEDDLTEPPVPLADHVSDSVEHAPGELTVPPGYSVLEG